MPGLEVDGIGDVGLPIGPVQAQQLIQQAVQAPYGRGEETIVDTDVRRVWQIEPKQFSIHNPAWDALIAEMVDTVKGEFGIDQRVDWDLCKLLIYEAGSFFAPHWDSEKVNGMFATLVVGLPSRHEGGTLVVSHDGETRTIDFGGPAGAYNVQYAAFYTDCKHEIEPVTSGYRVSLVYHLRLAGRKRQPTAPWNSKNVDQAATLLATPCSDSHHPTPARGFTETVNWNLKRARFLMNLILFAHLAFLLNVVWLWVLPAQAGEMRQYRGADGRLYFTNVPTARRLLPGRASAATDKRAAQLMPLVYQVAQQYDMDARLVRAMITVESNFNPRAVSRAGARGLMQLMPATARRYHVRNVFDPRANIEGGVRYLKDLQRCFRGDMRLILAAYNAGKGAVERYGGIPPYRETQRYVARVLALYGLPDTFAKIYRYRTVRGSILFTDTPR